MRMTTVFVGTNMAPVVRDVNQALALVGEVSVVAGETEYTFVERELPEGWRPGHFADAFCQIAMKHHGIALIHEFEDEFRFERRGAKP